MTEEHLAAATGSVLGIVGQLVRALAPLPLDEMLTAVHGAYEAADAGTAEEGELLVQSRVLAATIEWRDTVQAAAS